MAGQICCAGFVHVIDDGVASHAAPPQYVALLRQQRAQVIGSVATLVPAGDPHLGGAAAAAGAPRPRVGWVGLFRQACCKGLLALIIW